MKQPADRLPDPPLYPLEEKQLRSDAIDITRVICILGIVYVHAWTGVSNAEVQQHMFTWYGGFYRAVIEVLGRSSVPLLSVISGYLLASSDRSRNYGDLIWEKARSLLVPMACWNLIAIGIIGLGVVLAGYDAGFEPVGWALVDKVIHLGHDGSLNYQNAFLRDLFVCMLAGYWLIRAPKIASCALLAVTVIWTIGEWHLYVLLRPQILLFFIIGTLAARTDMDRAVRRLPFLPVLLAFVLVAGLKSYVAMYDEAVRLAYSHELVVLDNVLRVIAAVLLWRISLWLAGSRLAPGILSVRPYVFFLFCSHVLIMRGLSPLGAHVFGRFGDPLWLVYFVLQPLIVLAVVYLLIGFLRTCLPGWANILNGQRPVRRTTRPA